MLAKEEKRAAPNLSGGRRGDPGQINERKTVSETGEQYTATWGQSSNGDPFGPRTFISDEIHDIGLDVYEFRVYCHLQRLIQEGCAEAPSTREISRSCGVSQSAVSRVVGGLRARALFSEQFFSENETRGFVYLIRCAGVCKIGQTTDPDKRLKWFSTKLPFPVETLLVVEVADRFEVEKDLHLAMDHARLEGEWFTLTDAQVETVAEEMRRDMIRELS